MKALLCLFILLRLGMGIELPRTNPHTHPVAWMSLLLSKSREVKEQRHTDTEKKPRTHSFNSPIGAIYFNVCHLPFEYCPFVLHTYYRWRMQIHNANTQ